MDVTELRREHLKLHQETTFAMGACAGRFCSAVILALQPEMPVFVVDEVPNYHYVGDGEIELLGMSTVEWGELVVRTWAWWIAHAKGPKVFERCSAWVDHRTEFIRDLKRCKLYLKKNNRSPELRVEITREYFHTKTIFFAPWLDVLPNEISRARWPAEESTTRQVRAQGQDYTLDSLEHVVSRRPVAEPLLSPVRTRYLDQYLRDHQFKPRTIDPHTGAL